MRGRHSEELRLTAGLRNPRLRFALPAPSPAAGPGALLALGRTVLLSECQAMLLVVSIDTEEDQWAPCRGPVTVDNVRQLPRLEAFVRRLGLRPTYFTSYAVAAEPWAAGLLRGLHDDGSAEIAAHLHPWSTPPLAEPPAAGSTMLCNLPAALQRAKLDRLTAVLAAGMGARPTAFRAGRYGVGPATVQALATCGFRVDSSVTPYVSWADTDAGPDFVGAPLGVYRLGAGDVRVPDPRGAVLELPLSVGYTRAPFAVWDPLWRAFGVRPLRPLRLRGIAARLAGVSRVVLSPETATATEMLALARRLVARGLGYLHLTWHSPSLVPGLGPFVRTRAELDRFYGTIEGFLERLSAVVSWHPATVSEAAARLDAAGR